MLRDTTEHSITNYEIHEGRFQFDLLHTSKKKKEKPRPPRLLGAGASTSGRSIIITIPIISIRSTIVITLFLRVVVVGEGRRLAVLHTISILGDS